MHQTSERRDWPNAEQIARIRCGFAGVAADAGRFTATFYARLFEIAPLLRPMFPEDLSEQRNKLGRMLAMLVASLDRPLELRHALVALGARHRAYGVEPAHFVAVGEALLATLAEQLAGRFGAAERAAWTALYERIAASMQAGMEHAAEAA